MAAETLARLYSGRLGEPGWNWSRFSTSWQGWKGGQGLPHPFVPRMEATSCTCCPHVGSAACSSRAEPGAAPCLLLLVQGNVNPVVIHALPLRVRADLTRGCGDSHLPELAWKHFYSFSWKQTCDYPCPKQDSSALCPQGQRAQILAWQ